MRSTEQLGRVLHAMLEDPAAEHYGFDLSRRTHLKSGSLYPILVRMEGSGLVTSSWEDIDPATEGRPRRRYYKLTDAGAETARQYRPSRTTAAPTVRPSLGTA